MVLPPTFGLPRSAPEVADLRNKVRDALLTSSRHIRHPNFTRFGNDELELWRRADYTVRLPS